MDIFPFQYIQVYLGLFFFNYSIISVEWIYQYPFNLLMDIRLFSVFLYKCFLDWYTFPYCFLCVLWVPCCCAWGWVVLYFGAYWNSLSTSHRGPSGITACSLTTGRRLSLQSAACWGERDETAAAHGCLSVSHRSAGCGCLYLSRVHPSKGVCNGSTGHTLCPAPPERASLLPGQNSTGDEYLGLQVSLAFQRKF